MHANAKLVTYVSLYKTRGASEVWMEIDFIMLLWVGTPWKGRVFLLCCLGMDSSYARWNDLGLYCRIIRDYIYRDRKLRSLEEQIPGRDHEWPGRRYRIGAELSTRRMITKIWGYDSRGTGQVCETVWYTDLHEFILSAIVRFLDKHSLKHLEVSEAVMSPLPGLATGWGYKKRQS